jgi:Purine nucleoside phosphorylase
MTQSILGVVGGSGFYEMPGMKDARWETVKSPWGDPSDQILFADLEGLPVRFLPRHGRGHLFHPRRSTTAPTSTA